MDAALQLLTNSTYIKEAVIKNREKGPITEALAGLIDCHGVKGSTTPQRIKQLMGEKHYLFRGFGQQDSHEFITLFIEDSHREMCPQRAEYQEIKYDGLSEKEAYDVFIEATNKFENSDMQ